MEILTVDDIDRLVHDGDPKLGMCSWINRSDLHISHYLEEGFRHDHITLDIRCPLCVVLAEQLLRHNVQGLDRMLCFTHVGSTNKYVRVRKVLVNELARALVEGAFGADDDPDIRF